MKRHKLMVVLSISLLVCAAGTLQANTWRWEANNHTGSGTSWASNWTDNVHTLNTMTVGGNWNASWDTPSPGWMTIAGGYTSHTGTNGRYLMKSDFAGTCNNAADTANYWDVSRGLTVSAGINIPAVDGASGQGSLLVGVNNASTVGMHLTSPAISGNSFSGYLGWDESGSGVVVNFWTASGGAMRTAFTPSVNIIGVETNWTLGIKRVSNATDDTIVWDLWINGVAQAQDMLGPDGNYHTLVNWKNDNQGTGFYLGQRRSQPFNHETQWDYLRVTNEGVIAGWVPEPASLILLTIGGGLALGRRRS